jgi:hypothetical protein
LTFWTGSGIIIIVLGKQENQLHGGVAQLGERLNGIQEVMGSIPTVSTMKRHDKGRAFFFVGAREKFSYATHPEID